MSRSLPNSPNLELLRKQAKDLLAQKRAGDPSCLETLRLLHRFSGKSDDEILRADLKLTEAQYAVAMDYGFKSWKELKRYVDTTFKQMDRPVVEIAVEWPAHLQVRPLTRDNVDDIARFLLRIKAKMRPKQADGTIEGARYYVVRLLEHDRDRPCLEVASEASAVVYDDRTGEVVAVCMLGAGHEAEGFGIYDYYVDPAWNRSEILRLMFDHATNVIARRRDEVRAAGCVDRLHVWRDDIEETEDAKLFAEWGFRLTGRLDE